MFKQHSQAIAVVLLAIFIKAIPHAPNFSPEIVFALFIRTNYSRITSFFLISWMVILSDALFSYISGYTTFGDWTWFTYSGLLLVLFTNTQRFSVGTSYVRDPIFTVKNDQLQFVKYAVSLTLCYWLWTNFGVWLLSGMYAKSMLGFIECYTMALPFLGSAILGALFWSLLLVFSVKCQLIFYKYNPHKI